MLREVFWGTDVNHSKTLVAIENKVENPVLQQTYIFRQEDFPQVDEFYALKNQLYDRWRNGDNIEIPAIGKRFTWDLTKSATYPKELPEPEMEGKKEAIARKYLKFALNHFSKIYAEDIREGLLGFKTKIEQTTIWKAEDRAFIDNFEKLIRTGQDTYGENESKAQLETECLNGGDAKELRDILRDIKNHLDLLRNDLWESNYNEAYELVREIKEKCTNITDWRSTREMVFQVKNDIIEKELSRVHKDELMTEIKQLIQDINDKQTAEKAQYETLSQENYARLSAEIADLEPLIATTELFQPVRESLKKIQIELRDSKLVKEQRNELFDRLDKAFKALGERQSQEREQFLESSVHNYATLLERMEIGKKLAQFNDDFNETRELLKSIQADVSGSVLTREQREELRLGLNTAFEILNKRADKYYQDRKLGYEKRVKELDTMREKKRQEWEFRIKEKIMRAEQNIKNAVRSLENDQNFLQTLKDKFEDTADKHLVNSISRVEKQIEEKEARIAEMHREVGEFEAKLKES